MPCQTESQTVYLKTQYSCSRMSSDSVLLKAERCLSSILPHSICRHICDGSYQCPQGEDENACHQYNCSGLMHCVLSPRSQVCLHFVSICDGVYDCVSGEDEYLCDLPKRCPSSCVCLLYSILCEHFVILDQLNVGLFLTKFVSAKLDNITMESEFQSLKVKTSSNLIVFCWTKSSLSNDFLTNCAFLKRGRFLDFSENAIDSLSSQCFYKLSVLAVLLLPGNEISILDENIFSELKSLKKLDMSRNNLMHVQRTVLKLPSLIILNLSHNSFEDFDTDVADNINVHFVSIDDYRLCCLLKDSSTICAAEPQWPLNCNVLLDKLAIEVSTGTMSVLVFISNIIAISINTFQIVEAKKKRYYFEGNIKLVKKQTINMAFTTNLIWQNVNDILFGVYVITLFAFSRYYGQTFAVFSSAWLGSVTCKFLAVLSGFTKLNALYVANILTVSRLYAIKFPFKSKFKHTKPVLTALIAGSVSVCVFCLLCILILSFAEGETSLPSVLCSLTGKTKTSPTVITFTILTALLQLCVFVCITIMYIVIYRELSKPSQLESSKLKSDQQTGVLSQAVIIVLSYSLSWLPTAGVFVASTIVSTYPLQMLVWSVTFVSTVDSVMNPCIYCFFPLLKHCFKHEKWECTLYFLSHKFVLRKPKQWSVCQNVWSSQSSFSHWELLFFKAWDGNSVGSTQFFMLLETLLFLHNKHGARTVVIVMLIEECMVGSCHEHTVLHFQGSPCQINLYLKDVLLTKQDCNCIQEICMNMYKPYKITSWLLSTNAQM